MLEWINFKSGQDEAMPYQFTVKPLYHSNLGGRLKQQTVRRMSGFVLRHGKPVICSR